jgi:hypothetical protein
MSRACIVTAKSGRADRIANEIEYTSAPLLHAKTARMNEEPFSL